MIWKLIFPALAACAQMTTPYPPTIDGMRREMMETTSEERRLQLLDKIESSAPSSSRDVQALFDLFNRYPDKVVRGAVMASLKRLTPANASLETVFFYYLNDQDPASQIFGINGSLRLRSLKALPVIEKLAKEKFSAKSAEELQLVSEKNAWWVRYEALSALAIWKGDEAYDLVLRQSSRAPAAATIIGESLWSKGFPQILDWARSSSASDRDRAQRAFAADSDPRQLRLRREEMLRLARDPAQDRELRHQLALKVGFCSTDEEAAALVKEYESAESDDAKLMLATMIFASRSRHAIPLLKQYARENPDARARLGALVQLKDMLSAAEYRQVLEAFAKNDPDADNRDDAERQLRALGVKAK